MRGALCLLGALLLTAKNRQQDRQASQAVQAALQEIARQRAQAPAEDSAVQNAAPPDWAQDAAPKQPEAAEGGYLGTLEIPSLDLTLAVYEDFSEAQLEQAPCRQFGDAASQDLVIAGHNYPSQFGALTRLQVGERVEFTELDGVLHPYCAEKIETLQPEQVAQVEGSGYALVLYTCTYTGAQRLAVFCRAL